MPTRARTTTRGAIVTAWTLAPGLFGENLTVEGIDLVHALVGERWEVGSALLEVAQPRLPCFKLGIRMGDPRFPKRFQAEGRMGAYLRIIREGDVGAGDAIDDRLPAGARRHARRHGRGAARSVESRCAGASAGAAGVLAPLATAAG